MGDALSVPFIVSCFSHLLAPENTPENTFSAPVNLFMQSASTSPWPFSVTDNVSDFFFYARRMTSILRQYYINITLSRN